MPKKLEMKLMREARLKFGSVRTPRARRYIYGTMNKIKSQQGKHLVLTGNRQYINKMYKHLRAEHPSTRRRLFIR